MTAFDIRDPAASDETGWRRLWDLYAAFYRTAVPADVTDATWRRILDPASPIFARLAESGRSLVGFTVCVLHEGTWTVAPVCYLEDFFVADAARGQGVGRALMADVLALAGERGWSRVYWHTEGANAVARRLYDRFTLADGFVRYRVIIRK